MIALEDGTDVERERTRAVAAMHRHGREVREREVRRALRELPDDVDAETRAAVERLARRLVGRVLATPAAGLLAGEDDRVETALELFGSAREPSPAGETGTRDPAEDPTSAGT